MFIENPNFPAAMLIGFFIGLAYATRVESCFFFCLFLFVGLHKHRKEEYSKI
jgi:hypothetical protein